MNKVFETIPKQFNCAGFTIKVEIEDHLNGNNYGYFCDATNTIKLARTVDVEGAENIGKVTLTEQQIQNTFYHEVMHVWQFYFNNQYDEAQAQVFANFMSEFIRTKNMPF